MTTPSDARPDRARRGTTTTCYGCLRPVSIDYAVVLEGGHVCCVSCLATRTTDEAVTTSGDRITVVWVG